LLRFVLLSSQAILLSTHLADLLFADRRSRVGFATGIVAASPSKKAARGPPLVRDI
jgi:hypothetical protein